MASVRLHTSEGPMKICILHFLQLLNNVSPLSRWSEVVETSYVVDTVFRVWLLWVKESNKR